MRLIADSGSTKTTWALVDANHTPTQLFNTTGLNPRTTAEEQFIAIVKSALQQLPQDTTLTALTFYSAGCGTSEVKTRVTRYLHNLLPDTDVQVESDMLGACRALCCKTAGMVGILGTGSNACYYNGERVVKQVPSLGYVLGDEGSGNHIGRKLLKSCWDGTMPQELIDSFHKFNPDTLDEVLNHLYRLPHPNRYLATYAPFAAQNRTHPYIHTLLIESFSQYLQQQVVRLNVPDNTLHLVGSVAYTYREEIQEAASPLGLIIGKVLKEPIEGLIAYPME